jgi:hypothetical protein
LKKSKILVKILKIVEKKQNLSENQEKFITSFKFQTLKKLPNSNLMSDPAFISEVLQHLIIDLIPFQHLLQNIDL